MSWLFRGQDGYSDLRRLLARRQGGRCLICGRRLGPDAAMHHVIVARRHVAGWPKEQRSLIDHPCNVVLCCNEPCHLRDAHGEAGRYLIAWLIVQCGFDAIEAWVASLPWTLTPRWHRGLSAEEARDIVAKGVNI